MAATISTGNDKSQGQIFLGEISVSSAALLQCGMAKAPVPKDPELHLGDWLELLDTEIGEAAELAGCKQPYISNMIAGRKKNINVLILYRLSEALGVTVNDFYRAVPSKAQVNTLKNLSPRAQATLLARQNRQT